MEGAQTAGVAGRGARITTTEDSTMADGDVTSGGWDVAGTDAELIRRLQEALAVEQAKNQVLLYSTV